MSPMWTVIVLLWCGCGNACGAALTSRVAEAPQECEWQRVSGAAGEPTRVQLACSLRTVAGATDLLAGLSASQAQRITALDLHCTDTLFFESSLDLGRRKEEGTELLSRFHNLKELRIESCKIRYVPSAVLSPLSSLRSLIIRTHNTDWSAMSMEFHRDSFRGLTDLRNLDLGDNNIWILPSEIFCPLYNLKELNLTANRLQDISNLGFSDWGNGPTAPGKSCNTVLETLDMSDNEISGLPENGLSSLRGLQKLFIQDNRISNVADRAFVGLSDLQILNLSTNALTALPPEMFQSSRDIKQIYLNNNSLSVLAPGLLEGLDQLQILDLSVNELTSEWVNRDTFSGLVRLIVLNLSHNRLTKIDSLVFLDLNNLQFLSLEYNNIGRISEGAFSNLKNLHSLSLAHNNIIEVDSSHFSNLYVLNQLFLDGNKISKIDIRSFENITKLHDLGLSGNQLSEVPEAIKTLRFLTSLDLGMNRITKVTITQFEGLDDLYGLRLVGNKIEKISKDTFGALPSLQILNLASNNIDQIDDGAFALNLQLRAIGLDGNKLVDLKGIFINTQPLVWLNVSNNELLWFDYSHIPYNLEWLDMHENKIEKLEDAYDAKKDCNIKMLDVRHNKLRIIDEFSFPSSIETVVLNNNYIEKINPGTFVQKYNLNKVMLYSNKIKTLEIGAFALSSVPEDKDLPEFYISENPFSCDCTMEWLQSINQLSKQRQRPRIMDLESVKCSLTHSRMKSEVSLPEVKSSEFLCEYESHCFSLCHCCDFDACDCKMTCPDRCSCYHDLIWNSNVVDCSRAGYDNVPDRIPMDATEIYLDGNDLKELGNHVFIGKKRLQVLYLNNSNVNTIQNRTFNGIESLRILHLENNDLEVLRNTQFTRLQNLNELYLNNNKIRVIENDTFNYLPSLEYLNLDNNGYVDYMPWRVITDSNPRTRVSVEGNNWICDCKDVAELNQWLLKKSQDTENLMCYFAHDQPMNKTIAIVAKECKTDATTEETGTETLKRLFIDSSDSVENYIPYIAGVLITVLTLLLLCALILFMFREDFKLWLHSRYGIRVFSSTPKDLNDNKNKRFDAFFIYNIRDEDFVTRAVSSELENSGHSLCLQHRDLQLLERRSADSLVGAAESSKRLIIVLSISFIQQEWCTAESKAAVQSAINSVNVRHRRQKIIFLVTTDLSAINIDPDLKVLLKTCTVIVWGEKNCWEKLNFRLPDVDVTLPNRTLHNANNLKTANRETFGRHGNLRYTAPPTAHDPWYQYAPPVLPMASPLNSTSASAEVSARSTEDETCSVASSEGRPDDRLPHHHSYVSIDNHQCEVRPLRPPQQIPLAPTHHAFGRYGFNLKSGRDSAPAPCARCETINHRPADGWMNKQHFNWFLVECNESSQADDTKSSTILAQETALGSRYDGARPGLRALV
ncbi:Toll-like receptor Tollo [Eumeta japonica]|uniref:Toll-like receptor Tollo n=1 Tax=Eumeta variegata TaxID=151549 RepID=A0A4C1YWA3_EUMVA|nr:Toll-like receptor Tollo [Eumeta japonica]